MKSGGSTRSTELGPVLVIGVAVAWFFAPLLTGRALVAEPDALAALLPLKAFLARSLASGQWPLWNPDASLGKPFLPDLLAGALYPPNLLLAVPPFERGLNLLFVGHYAFTALGAVLWLRAAGLTRSAAVLGALVWTFGGTMISMGNVLNQLLSAAWLPWVLWAWLRPHALGAKIALSALAMGLALLAGGPEMVLVAAIALLVTSRHPASLLVPPLAFLLAAVELLPFYFYLTKTWRGTHGIDLAMAMQYSVPPSDLIQLARDTWRPSPERFMPQIYVGPAVLVLAVVGALTVRRAWFWVLVAVASLLVVLGSHTPVYPFLYAHLPLSNLLRYPEKLFLGVHALIAAGAAAGSGSLVAFLARRGGTRTTAVLASALGVALCGVVFLDLARANRDALYAPRPEVVLDPPPVARAILADHASRAATAADASAHARDPESATAHRAPRIYANPLGRPIPRSLPAAVALDRNLPWGAVAELYGLANVNAPSSLNLVKHEWLQETLGVVPRATAIDALAALGTEYVTSWTRIDDVPAARALPVPDERIGVKLYALDANQGRTWVATRVREASDARSALQRFVGGDGDAGAHAGLALVERGALPAAALGDDGSLGRVAATAPPRPRIVRDEPHALEIQVALPAAGLLVVNDTMLDGWQAWVDDAPASLVEVNGLVRGVWLDAGAHRVRMRYLPHGLGLGAGLTLLALLVAGGALWSARRRATSPARSARSAGEPRGLVSPPAPAR